MRLTGTALLVVVLIEGTLLAHPMTAPQAYRKPGQPVQPVSDTTIICEAEEFQVTKPGWQARPWGTNYYAATFANSFLSRKAYLGAPEQCERSVATIDVQVPKAGRYLALVRYEAAYHFETQFRLQVQQNGRTVLDRLYGARDNLKIWAFKEKLKKEHAWPWGAVENVVWEGHDAHVELAAGKAQLSLIADKQPGNAARRNVDLVLLTSDETQVKKRIDEENYLPLDGMLTQAGDVFLKLHNAATSSDVTVTVNPCREHSPYWVHIRDWKPKTLTAKPGQSTEWLEVGSLLDSLNDGQWELMAKGKGAVQFDLEFGVRAADGKIESIKRFEKLSGNVALAYDADTRYSHRIRLDEDVLYDLLSYLKSIPTPGKPPQRTLVYGGTFDPKPGNARYNAVLDEFKGLFNLSSPTPDNTSPPGMARGYIDVRGVLTEKLEAYCKSLQAEGKADKIAVVSMGDEIGLPAPPADDHRGFRTWLASQKLRPADVDPAADDNWDKVQFDADPKKAAANPGRYYYSRRYANHFGIQALKQRTDILKKHLPNAGIGANFSPHHHHAYLPDVAQWIMTFREGGMTQPWGEDYIWQLPVGTQQMNFICLDAFRAGIRGQPDKKIHYYVMPHWPGNTPNSWRRQFYGDLAHGMKIINLFEFRPVQAAYTENHCSLPAMYQEVRKSLHELGQFEDIIQDGQVRPAQTALWFSEAADIWDDYKGPFAAAKRALYIAIRHEQIPLDFVVEQDALNGTLKQYKLLYLTDAHVSRAASKAITEWVTAGGRLFATAGAGMLDEFDKPNTVLRELLGVEPADQGTPAGETVRFIKQDLPFSEPIAKVTWEAPHKEGRPHLEEIPAIALRSRFAVRGSTLRGTFGDGSPAITVNAAGKGQVAYCGFLPGLSYFKPAIPLRPVDRGSTDDAMAHFLPTAFDASAARLIGLPAAPDTTPPTRCSQAFVETSVIESRHGAVVSLVNWSGKPIAALKLALSIDMPDKQISLASGKPVKMSKEDGKRVFTLDLDEADALILRP